MLYDRIQILVEYVAGVVAGSATKDYDTLRALTALVASLPASENPVFREEFDTVCVIFIFLCGTTSYVWQHRNMLMSS